MLKNLIALALSGTNVSDEGTEGKLGNLKSLKVLDLSLTNLTDAGLKELVNLNNLVYLDLGLHQRRVMLV